MKKLILTITLFSYLAVTSGVIVNFHYCMNRLASTQIFGEVVKVCAKCGMDIHKAKGCCRDEVKVIKLKMDQKTGSFVSFALPQPDQLVQEPSGFIVTPFINTLAARHTPDHAPPEPSTAIYIKNRVFRI